MKLLCAIRRHFETQEEYEDITERIRPLIDSANNTSKMIQNGLFQKPHRKVSLDHYQERKRRRYAITAR